MIAEVVKSEEPQRETDALEEEFFSTPPEAFATEIDGWDPAPMSASTLLAMRVTIAMLVCCGLSLLGFAALADVVFVRPVALGAAHAQLPDPAATASLAPAAVAAPELAARPHAAPIAAQAALAAAVTLAPPATLVPQATIAAPTTVAPDATVAPRAPRAAQPVARASPAEKLVKRAHVALGQGQANEAQQLATQAILLDPRHARSYIVLGGARDALGDSAGVRAAFRACVQRAEGPLVSTCKTLAR